MIGTGYNDITEILLKITLSTITLTLHQKTQIKIKQTLLKILSQRFLDLYSENHHIKKILSSLKCLIRILFLYLSSDFPLHRRTVIIDLEMEIVLFRIKACTLWAAAHWPPLAEGL